MNHRRYVVVQRETRHDWKQPGQNFPDNFEHIGFDLRKRSISTRTGPMIVVLDEDAYDEDEKSVISLNNPTAAEAEKRSHQLCCCCCCYQSRQYMMSCLLHARAIWLHWLARQQNKKGAFIAATMHGIKLPSTQHPAYRLPKLPVRIDLSVHNGR